MLNFIKSVFRSITRFFTDKSEPKWYWIWDDVTETAIPVQSNGFISYYFAAPQGKKAPNLSRHHKNKSDQWDTENLIELSESNAKAFFPGLNGQPARQNKSDRWDTESLIELSENNAKAFFPGLPDQPASH